MNGKFASAGIVLAMIVGLAGPLQAQAVSGAVGGATGGFAQGNFGGAAHGRLDGAAHGNAEAGVSQRPDHRGMIRRGGGQAQDTAGTARERGSVATEGSASKATGVAGRISDRADDARPELDRPQRPGRPQQRALPQQPAEAGPGLATAAQGDANADRSGARATAGGTSSAEASGSAWDGTEASAGASGAAQAEVAADAPR
jgi:hypothetical protein